MAEEQLTFTTLGGETFTVKKRGKHYIEPRGYAQPPGTGPKGETCGTCEHLCHGRRYSKCELMRRAWTHGRGTDVLVRAAACRKWEKKKEEPQ